MEKIKLAVAGTSLYAGRLAESIRRQAPDCLEVYACGQAGELRAYAEQLQPDILVYEPDIVPDKADMDGLDSLPGNILQIRLSAQQSCGQNYQNCCHQNGRQKEDGEKQGDGTGHPHKNPEIFRYQKSSEILRQIFLIYESSSKKSLAGWCRTADLEMTSFYAPGGHEMQLAFSLAFASACGEGGKVLYLNLAEFSGMQQLFDDRDGNTFSDLIYGIRQKKEQFLLCLQGVLHHAVRFDYVLAPENPEDLLEIQEDDLECLLALLQEQTDYETIIWNCGGMNHVMEQVMRCSSRVYAVVKDRSFGKYRKAEFDKYLQKERRRWLRERVEYISPQAGSGSFVPGVDILSQIQSGVFAQQARALLENGTGQS